MSVARGDKLTGSLPLITGQDLRHMRLLAQKTTQFMANYAAVKSRKTYENWEANRTIPNINQFMAMAINCGFHPGLLMVEFYQRDNRQLKNVNPEAINWDACRLN